MGASDEVYEALASALAGAREPDLSAFPGEDVRCAVSDALAGPAGREAFVAWLDGRVRALSGGRVSVDERPTVHDDGAVTLRLSVAGEAFAEPVVLRADAEAPLRFPMRGG